MKNKYLVFVVLASLFVRLVDAGLVADYPLDHAEDGLVEAGHVLDRAGAPPADGIRRINWPFWCTETRGGVLVPSNTSIGAPADGVAIGMTLSNGHELDSRLFRRISGKPFTVFFRLYSPSGVDMRFRCLDRFSLRVLSNPAQTHCVWDVSLSLGPDGDRTKILLAASAGAPDQWHDYVVTFTPGKSLIMYVDGKEVAQTYAPELYLDPGSSPFHYENYSRQLTYLESMRFYDEALSAAAVKTLSSH